MASEFGRIGSSLIGHYMTSTPFPFASTLTRKRSSIPARKQSSLLAQDHNRKRLGLPSLFLL